MFARCCPEPLHSDESPSVRQDGFDKEIAASQETFKQHQVLSYSAFFRTRPGINDPGQYWVNLCHNIRKKFHQLLHRKVLFPTVQRKKNVSDETAASYQIYEKRPYVRTVDLEVLRAQRGYEIGGECEMRSAWKFNDLKPRQYYCIGGEQYFVSSYMRDVAVGIMESIGSTHVKIRTDPTSYMYAASDEYITAWDFTSFTTTLSELKHFLWFLARMAEADATVVRLFDYRDGFIDCPLYTLIDDYNQHANLFAGFSIHRMMDFVMEGASYECAQVNSGMLGVPGNIGFSTALHGLVICRECGVGKCVCVGDDALGITQQHPSASLLHPLSQIGNIHPDKFGIITPANREGRIKFLKRSLGTDGDQLTMNFLLNFPVANYIDGNACGRDAPIDFSMEARMFKVCSHTASLLWDIRERRASITDEDGELVMDFLYAAFKYMRLPTRGMMPGGTLRYSKDGEVLMMSVPFIIPPIKGYDAREVDWLEWFIRNTTSTYFLGTVYIPHTQEVEVLRKGDELVMPESTWLSAMEDLGYVEVTAIKEWLLVLDVGNARVLKRMCRYVDDGLVAATSVKVLKGIPERYYNTVPREDVYDGIDITMDI